MAYMQDQIISYNKNMNTINYYKVGGFVRDRIMKIPSKDIDFAVEAPSFEAMEADILAKGGEIFLKTPEFFTIRAKMSKMIVADFVLCRKEGTYSDNRHPDSVEMGTLYDDLARRDFTMNAIAMDDDGNYIDPFHGIRDIEHKIIDTVGKPEDRFKEDYIRILRALRFEVTKGFHLSDRVNGAINRMAFSIKGQDENRVRDEVVKMFRHNTLSAMRVLRRNSIIEYVVFNDYNIWLKPTSEMR